MELGSYFLFLQEQIKDIIICSPPGGTQCPFTTRLRAFNKHYYYYKQQGAGLTRGYQETGFRV